MVTGPLALVLNLSTGYPYPQSSTDFQFWITRIANDAMRQRYQRIMTDLTEHYKTRGYSQTRARLLAEDLFHQKSAIYYPLVHHASPNLGALGPKDSRNPYGNSTLANSAADNYNLGLLCQKVSNHEQAAQLFHQAALTGHAGAQASWLICMRPAKASLKTQLKQFPLHSPPGRAMRWRSIILGEFTRTA